MGRPTPVCHSCNVTYGKGILTHKDQILQRESQSEQHESRQRKTRLQPVQTGCSLLPFDALLGTTSWTTKVQIACASFILCAAHSRKAPIPHEPRKMPRQASPHVPMPLDTDAEADTFLRRRNTPGRCWRERHSTR